MKKNFAEDDDDDDEESEEQAEDEDEPLRKARNQRKDRIHKLIKQNKVKLDGFDIPYPVSNFSKMRKRY